MGKFDGKYIFESGENIEPCMKVLGKHRLFHWDVINVFFFNPGFPEDMCSKMLDAKNKTTITILENSDGSFTYTVEYSLLPEMNFSNTYKVNYTIQEVNSTTSGDIIFRLEKLPRWKNPGPLFRR